MTCIKSSVYVLDEQPEETLFVIYSRNKCNSFDEERISKMIVFHFFIAIEKNANNSKTFALAIWKILQFLTGQKSVRNYDTRNFPTL